jgi:DNA-binding NarL/FixJ family response regulator
MKPAANTQRNIVSELKTVDTRVDSGLRIFILARQDFLVDRMFSILSRQEQNYLVSCVEPGDSCVARFEAASPDVLLLHKDAIEPPLDQFIQNIRTHYPDMRILIFGQGLDDNYLYGAVRAGIHGYVNEQMTGDHVVHAVQTVYHGGNWYERRIMERFVSERVELDAFVKRRFRQNVSALAERLTRRETEVLREVVKGLSIKEIAEQIHLSTQGVKAHLAKLFRKFEVTNRSQLILKVFDLAAPVEDAAVILQESLGCEDPG